MAEMHPFDIREERQDRRDPGQNRLSAIAAGAHNQNQLTDSLQRRIATEAISILDDLNSEPGAEDADAAEDRRQGSIAPSTSITESYLESGRSASNARDSNAYQRSTDSEISELIELENKMNYAIAIYEERLERCQHFRDEARRLRRIRQDDHTRRAGQTVQRAESNSSTHLTVFGEPVEEQRPPGQR